MLADPSGKRERGSGVNERRILATFVVDGQIERLPAKLSKRLVLYRWLLQRFESGWRMSEAEVNRVLRSAYADTATIRREMIVHGLLERTPDGTYWRPNAHGE